MNNDRNTQGGTREQDDSHSRRLFLTRSAGVLIGTGAGASQLTSAAADDGLVCPTDLDDDNEDDDSEDEVADGGGGGESEEPTTDRLVESFPIQEGTEYATEGYIIDAAEPGPTVVILGGIHGDEVAGYRAANAAVDWDPDRGTLVVIPEANAVAVERGTRSSGSGDLNRQFPTGRDPTTPLARELWEIITEVDPDLVIDLHTSRGIWDSDVGPSGYGQAIFPTAAARSTATDVANAATTALLDESKPDHLEFSVGNTLTGARPLLIHKVGGDLNLPGYLLETTHQGTDVATRTEWLEGLTAKILSQSGIEI
jgi:hypothetical protein